MPYEPERIEHVISELKRIAENGSGVRDIEDHFAGYFDELGINVNLLPECDDEAWSNIAIQMLLFLNSALPKDNPHFPWILSFWRNLVQVGLFFPGDSLEDNCADAILRKR